MTRTGPHWLALAVLTVSTPIGAVAQTTTCQFRGAPDALAERGPGQSELDLPFVVFDQDAAR